MEVIAYIPALPSIGSGDDIQKDGAATPAAAVATVSLPEPISASPTIIREACPQPTGLREEAIRPRSNTGSRRPVRGVFSPSVLALSVVAAAVWAAAWRNDRLRAIEQQRPQRVAMEPTPSVGPERSVMP